MAKLSEIRLGLATVIPWSLVLILGTLQIANVTHRGLPETPAVDDVNSGVTDSQETVSKEETVANKLDNVRQEFDKIEDKSDKVLIYKLLSGASEYLKNSKHLESTSQFDPILGRVQSSYGWARDKYPEFTTAVSEYLVAAGYDKPRKLETQEDRDWFQSIFSALAGAIR